mgnify:CR=1 FL=1
MKEQECASGDTATAALGGRLDAGAFVLLSLSPPPPPLVQLCLLKPLLRVKVPVVVLALYLFPCSILEKGIQMMLIFSASYIR